MTSIFPEFDYKAEQLCKFISASGLFTIMLKSGDIIHYTPIDKEAFAKWLMQHNIQDIR